MKRKFNTTQTQAVYLQLKPYLAQDPHINRAFAPLFETYTPIEIYNTIDFLIVKLDKSKGGRVLENCCNTLEELRLCFLRLAAHLHKWTALEAITDNPFKKGTDLELFKSGLEIVADLDNLFILMSQQDHNNDLEGINLGVYTAVRRAYFVHYASQQGWEITHYESA